MMTTKKDVPPPRPPAPKLSLLKSKQSSTGSIAIRFNALSNQDDDDDIDLTITGDSKVHNVAPAGRLAGDTHSAPSSQAGTPMSKPISFSGNERHSPIREAKADTEKSSFLGGIKETLKDKIQATLNEKILDIADSESRSIVSNSPSKEIKLQKAHSLDSPKLGSSSSIEGLVSDVLKEDVQMVGSSSVQRGVTDTSQVTECAHEVTEDSTLSPANGPMRIVDNFYEDEFFEVLDNAVQEDVDLGTKFGTPTSSSFKNMMKSKSKPSRSSDPIPLSMSTLLHSVTDDDQDEIFKDVLNSEASSRKNSQEDTQEAQIDESSVDRSKEMYTRQNSNERLKPPPWQKIGALVAALFAYMIVPLPSYLSGMCVGAALATLGFVIYNWINAPPVEKPAFVLPDITKLPPLLVPEMKDTRIDDGKFKGWMNELIQYDPENYHINQTHSIYVQLEGTTLRLQRPKQNIAKRGMWDEERPTPSFIHQRHLDIKNSSIVLLPFGLCEKRQWSKKYPICLTLAKTTTESKRTGSDNQDAEQIETEAKLPENSSNSDLTGQDIEYQMLTKDSCDVEVIYLFGRTCREKEDWFQRFSAAANGVPLPQKLQYVAKALPSHSHKKSETETTKSDPNDGMPADTKTASDGKSEANFDPDLIEYVEYMGKIMPANTGPKSPQDKTEGNKRIACDPQILWTNALIGRLFWDFLRDQYWAEKVKEKIQRKLSKIHVPYFIDELTVTDINLGGGLPTIRRASRPYLDEQGLWIDFDVAYNGGFQMSLETKVNLMKLKKKTVPTSSGSSTDLEKSLSPATHSDEEDSAESSTDEEEEERPADITERIAHGLSGKGKKLWRIVDKIAQSRYFQQATEYKYIKRAMEEVSNTRLVLTVEVKSFAGKLVVNIPPPPTNRLWYGFRATPQLWLSAKPKVGERQVTMTHITEWIEKKLETEFQRVLVIPNLDDIPIPIMRDSTNSSDVGAKSPPNNQADVNSSASV